MPKPLTAEELEILLRFLRWRGHSTTAAAAKISEFQRELNKAWSETAVEDAEV